MGGSLLVFWIRQICIGSPHSQPGMGRERIDMPYSHALNKQVDWPRSIANLEQVKSALHLPFQNRNRTRTD